jgi:HEAT repeat protein
VSIKRAVLRGYMMSRDTEHLLVAAKTEQNPELRREAIDQLGNMQASNELAQLYTSESNFEWKERILRSLSRSQNAVKILEVARTDRDSRLRLVAVRSLHGMRKEVTPDDLVALYGTEPEVSVRAGILDALFSHNAVKQIVEVTRKETDPELKRRAVQRLANSKSKEATDYLVELLNK